MGFDTIEINLVIVVVAISSKSLENSVSKINIFEEENLFKWKGRITCSGNGLFFLPLFIEFILRFQCSRIQSSGFYQTLVLC